MGSTPLLLLLLYGLSADALRVLVVFPVASKSHNILGQGVAKILHDAGHEVVYVTSFPRANLPPRMREVDVSIDEDLKEQQSKKLEAFKLKNLVSKANFADSLDFLLMVHDIHRRFLEHQNVTELLNDKQETFDVAIIEWFFSESLAGIPAVFQCPMIWLGSTEAHGPLLRIIDEVASPAYNADLFSSRTPPFTFLERGAELWTAVKRHWHINYHLVPLERALYHAVYSPIAAKRGVSISSYDDVVYNASFMFLNSHPSVGTPFRLPQNVKYVAGYHIDKEVKPLPKDLQNIFDKSRTGVIYFSMGSYLQSNDMSQAMKESLLKMFGRLKQSVVWKFEGHLENVPQNVHLVKWAPQQSILAHPNVKFFITHGGQLSITEALHFGVPVIGIPVFGDQHVNIKAVERKGFGVTVQLTEELADDLGVAIDYMLKDPNYTTSAKHLSSIYHDRPTTPEAEILHWTEHVVKTQGAPHLRSPALLLPWYQKIYLDYLVLVFIFVVYVLQSILRRYGLRNRSKRVEYKRKYN